MLEDATVTNSEHSTHDEIVSHKQTRAQIYRDKVSIHIATPEYGLKIESLLAENNVVFEHCDWTKISANWLVAIVAGEVIGCCTVLPAPPMGFVEFLNVKPSTPIKLKMIAVQKLCIQAMATLQLAGCQYLLGFIEEHNGNFADVLKKHNFRYCESGSVVMKWLGGMT